MHDFWGYILQLLQRGIFFAVPAMLFFVVALVVVWLIARKKNRSMPWKKIIISFVLLGWLVVTIYATLLRGEPGYRQCNFHLFLAWREAWNQFTLQVWLNVILNIALFVPLGILLPLLIGVFKKWYFMLLAGFGTTLLIESAQLVASRGIFDIDDLFTNTLGAMLGWSVIMIITVIAEQKWKKSSFTYLCVPAAIVIVFAGIYIGYMVQPYGNLPDAATVTANLDSVKWNLEFVPEEMATTEQVYQAGRLNKEESEKFGEEIAKEMGIEFDDIYYYDDAIIFANHSTGDFLNLNQRDGTWEYTIGREKTPVYEKPLSDINNDDILAALSSLNIKIPNDAQFEIEISEVDGFGTANYAAQFVPVGDKLLYGTLSCNLHFENGKTTIDRKIKYNIVELSPYKEESIITQNQALSELYQGHSFEGTILERLDIGEISILSCSIEWITDTKGFYQPVYRFELQINEQEIITDYVPALK